MPSPSCFTTAGLCRQTTGTHRCCSSLPTVIAWLRTTGGIDATLLATTAAWAVVGAARRWFQTPNRIPAEEMAVRIETIVKPVLFGASQ